MIIQLIQRNRLPATLFLLGCILMFLFQYNWLQRHQSQYLAVRLILSPFATGLLFCSLALLKSAYNRLTFFLESSLSLASLFFTDKPRKRDLLWASLILAILLLLSFANIVFGGRTLLTSPISPGAMPSGPYGYVGTRPPLPVIDPGASAWQNEPMAARIKTDVQSGRIPLWNPNTGVGVPLLGNIISAPFSPFRAPLLLSDSPVVWDLCFLTRLFAAGLFTYIYLRLILISPLGSMVGSVSFMLCGYFIEYINMCHLDVEVLFPLLVLAFECLFREWRPRNILFASGSVCASVLGGMPESTFFVLFLAFGYYFFRVLFDNSRRSSGLAVYWIKHTYHFSLPVALGILLSGPQLFPFFDFLRNAAHVHSEGIGLQFAPVLGAITFLCPYFFGKIHSNFNGISSHAFMPYFGVLPIILALIGVFSGTKTIAPKLRYLFLFFVVFCLLKSYGSPVVNWIGYLPVFSQLIFPKYCTPLVSFCIAALAAIGFDSLIQAQISLRRILWPYAMLFALVLIYFGTRSQDFFTPLKTYINLRHVTLHMIVAIVLSLGLYYFISLLLHKDKLCFPAIGVALLLFGELFYYIPKNRPSRYDPATIPPYVQFLKHDSQRWRVLGLDYVLYPNTSMFFDIDCITDLNPMYPSRYVSYIKTLIYSDMYDRFAEFQSPVDIMDIRKYLSILNVKYILAAGDYQSSKTIADIMKRSSFTPADRKGIGKTSFTINNKTRAVLFQHAPSSIRYPVRIQPGHVLSFSIALNPECWSQRGDGVEFSIKVDDGALVRKIFCRTIDPQNVQADRKWLDYSLPLDDFSNRDVTLVLETHERGNSYYDWAGWGDIKLGPLVAPDSLPLVYDKEVQIYQNPEYLPRVMTVPKAIYFKSGEEALDALRNSQFDLKSTALIEGGDGFYPDEESIKGFRGEAYITKYESARVSIKANLSAQGFLILNDLHFPGWKAYVDGIQHPILTANYLFRGLKLTAGSHRVDFVYDPVSFKLGCFSFAASFLFLFFLALAGGRSEKSPKQNNGEIRIARDSR